MSASHLAQHLVTNGIYAILFAAVVGILKEPARQKSMAILIAMAGGLFAVEPFAELGFCFGALIAVCGYFGLKWYPSIGIGWILHACWDTVRYFNDAGLVGQEPHSSLGCAIFDPMIAVWFFFGAPSVWDHLRSTSEANTTSDGVNV